MLRLPDKGNICSKFIESIQHCLDANALFNVPDNVLQDTANFDFQNNESHVIRLINYYLRLIAKITLFCKEAKYSDHCKIEIVEIMSIMQMMYQSRRIFLKPSDKSNLGVPNDLIKELETGLSFSLQGMIIKDRAPTTQIEKIIAEILNRFIQKLLDMRAHLSADEKVRENDADNGEQLHYLQCIRDGINQVDAVLWRLNLFPCDWIRENLRVHIERNPVPDNQYVLEKWHRDTRRQTVLSHLINDIMTPGSTEFDARDKFARDLCKASSILYSHISDLEVLVSNLRLLTDKDRYVVKDGFAFRTNGIRNIAIHQIMNLCFDCQLLKSQAESILAGYPQFDDLMAHLQFINYLALTFQYLIHAANRPAIEAELASLDDYFVNITVLRHDMLNSTISMFNCLRLESKMKLAGDDQKKRRNAIKNAVREIEHYLKQLTSIKNDEHAGLLRIFIKDYYMHVFNECKSEAEVNKLNKNDLTKRVAALKVQSGNANIYQFLLKYPGGDNSKPENLSMPELEELARLFDRKLKNMPDKTESNISLFLQALYIWRAGVIGDQLQKKGSAKQKSLGLVLCAMVNTCYVNSYQHADQLLAKIAPNKLIYKPPSLEQTPPIEYPNAEMALCHFFNICNEIRNAELLENFSAINKKLESMTLVHKAIETKGFTKQQLELYLCEKNALIFLSMLNSFRIMEFGAKLDDKDKATYYGNIDAIRSIKLNAEGPSGLAYGFNSYMVFAAMCILLRMNTYNKNAWESLLSDILALMSNLYVHQQSFDTEVKYRHDKYLTKEVHTTLHHALAFAHSRDRAPGNNPAEEFVYWMINVALHKLVPMREAFEENERAMVTKSHSAEGESFDKHFEVFAARNQLSKLDSILSRCNLREYPALRKRYQSHLSTHCIREEFNDSKWMLSPKRITSISGLLNIDLRNPMKSCEQFKIAGAILNCYVQDCVLMMGANNVITRGVNDDYPDLQRMIFEILTSVNFDSALLYLQMGQLYNTEPSMTATANELRILHQITIALLLSVYRKDASYTKANILDFDVGHISLKCIFSAASAQTCNAVLQQRLTSELEIAKTPEERETAFKAVSESIEKLCIKWVTEKRERKNEAYYQLQFISDYYIYALSQCYTEKEASFFTNEKLKKQVFDLKLPSYNNFSRDYLYLIINESRKARIKHSIKNSDNVNLDQIDSAVLPECIELLDKRIQSRAMALQLWGKAPSDNTEVISMTSTMLVQVLETGEELYGLVNKRYPQIPRKYANEASTLLFAEAEKFYQFLNLMDKYLDPEKLCYKPMVMKVVEVDKTTFLDSTIASKANNKKPAAQTKKGEKPSQSAKPEAQTKVSQPVKLDPGSNITTVKEFYKNNLVEIQNHFFQILDSGSYKIDRNSRAKAVVGLVSCLPSLKNIDDQDALAKKIEGYLEVVTAGYQKNMMDNLFECNYKEMLKTIAKYKKVAPPPPPPAPVKEEPVVVVAEEPAVSTQIDSQRRFMQRRERHYRQEKGQTRAIRPAPRKLSTEAKPDYLSSCRLPIPITSISCSQDEIRFMKLLYDNDHYPLLQGGVIGDAILGLPYRDIDAVCFATSEELCDILTKNQKYLNISKFEPMFGIFYRITFNGLDINGEPEYFDMAFVPEMKEEKILQALIDLAECFGLSTAIYYCLFTQTIVDPCGQYERLRKGILNTITSMLESHQFLIENPDRMLVVIAKEAKCRKYNVTLDTEFIRRTILANIQHLTVTNPSCKFHQSLFDKLFIHGFSKEAGHLLHDEYNAMVRLFPMLENTEADKASIYRACAKTAERHSLLEAELVRVKGFDPKKRVCMFSNANQNYLRTTFLDDLLYQKFFDKNYYQRYLTANNLDILIENDARQYLSQCSFVINRSVLTALTKMWQQRIYQQLSQDRAPSPAQKLAL